MAYPHMNNPCAVMMDQESSVVQKLNPDHCPFILDEMNLEILHGFLQVHQKHKKKSICVC